MIAGPSARNACRASATGWSSHAARPSQTAVPTRPRTIGGTSGPATAEDFTWATVNVRSGTRGVRG